MPFQGSCDLVVAMNCGNYRQTLMEQSRDVNLYWIIVGRRVPELDGLRSEPSLPTAHHPAD